MESRQDEDGQTVTTLTLTDVITLAMQNNRGLTGSRYSVDSQSFSVDAAQSAFEWKYFPTATAATTTDSRRIGGGVTVEKKFTPGPIFSVSPEIARNDGDDITEPYGSQVGVSLTVPLLRGFGADVNLDRTYAAQYALRTARRSYHTVKVNTVLEAVSATYNIVQQRELVHLFQDQAARFRAHAVMAEAMEKIGLATPIDVYRAQIRLRDAQDDLTRAKEALRSAGDRLKIVLAAPLEQAIHVVAPLDGLPVDIDVAEAVQTALAHRVEVRQADDDLAEAKRATVVSKDNLSPQLDLVAHYRRWENDSVLAGTTQFSEEFWALELVSTTDWSRTAEKAAYQQSLLAIARTRLNRSTRIDSIKREVRQAYDSLIKSNERLMIRDDQIKQAEGKLALARIKFNHGMADNFDLIEAETELQEARSNSLAARIESIVGTYRLRAAIGTLVES